MKTIEMEKVLSTLPRRKCINCNSEVHKLYARCSILIAIHAEVYKDACPCSSCLVKAHCNEKCKKAEVLFHHYNALFFGDGRRWFIKERRQRANVKIIPTYRKWVDSK